jgi:hypothetical protein
MTIMDNGCIEIGKINTKASTEVIKKLKFILDQHEIFHIIDGVMFYHPHQQAVQVKASHQGRVREISKAQDDFQMQYRELIVPDLYKLNFMSLVFFDAEEADFLATLVYGEI